MPESLRPRGGLISSFHQYRPSFCPPGVVACWATIGDLSFRLARDPLTARMPATSGTGFAHGDEAGPRAALIAAMESLERYAASLTSHRAVRTAARDLGDATVPVDRFPSCSLRELSHPLCPVRQVGDRDVIDWVPATDLCQGNAHWLPAELVYMSRSTSAQHWLPFSTGLAVGTSLEDALMRATYEVVERDAIGVVWHQMMALPAVPEEELSARGRSLLSYFGGRGVQVRILDATTDLALPIAYLLFLAEQPVPHQWVSACCTSSMPDAVDHALDEGWMLGEGLRLHLFGDPDQPPGLIMEGALELGLGSQRDAFDFLEAGSRPAEQGAAARGIQADAPASPARRGSRSSLGGLVDNFRSRGLDLLYHQFDCPELEDAGVVAVRVVSPQLQPLSVSPYVQYKAHPRLYELPARLGREPLDEDQLNPWRQPFA